MKQVNLTITFGTGEKFLRPNANVGKKELDLDREMTHALVKLYEKYVPAPVRGISMRAIKRRRPSKAPRSPEASHRSLIRTRR